MNALVKALRTTTRNLYHYCSNESFLSIIQSGVIRLSAMDMTNDLLEGKLVRYLWKEAASPEKLEFWDIEKMEQAIAMIEKLTTCFAFCLSERSDLLSQWRGYASDGAGFSIGFRSDRLMLSVEQYSSTPPELRRLIYKREEQIELLREPVKEIVALIKDGALGQKGFRGGLLQTYTDEEVKLNDAKTDSLNQKLFPLLLSLESKLFITKSDSFQEEAEWRLMRGVSSEDTKEPVSYRSGNQCLVPYVETPIAKSPASAISHVVIGPKNKTPIKHVKRFLESSGYGEVDVSLSSSSYR